jgi:hypothetical protein
MQKKFRNTFEFLKIAPRKVIKKFKLYPNWTTDGKCA